MVRCFLTIKAEVFVRLVDVAPTCVDATEITGSLEDFTRGIPARHGTRIEARSRTP
jgi:hypothetical protein